MTVKEFMNSFFTMLVDGLRSVHIPSTNISLYYFIIGLFLSGIVISIIKSVLNFNVRKGEDD